MNAQDDTIKKRSEVSWTYAKCVEFFYFEIDLSLSLLTTVCSRQIGPPTDEIMSMRVCEVKDRVLNAAFDAYAREVCWRVIRVNVN